MVGVLNFVWEYSEAIKVITPNICKNLQNSHQSVCVSSEQIVGVNQPVFMVGG